MEINKVPSSIIKKDLSKSDVARISESKIIAVDCEMAGLNPHRDPLYLVQICDRDRIVNIVKTRNWLKAVNLQKVLCDPNITKVFHFAIMDCGFILKQLHVLVQSVYCTKIASKIARTYASSHSLSSLLEELLGIVVDKKQQTTFWGKDQITPEQLDYAVNDIKHLLEIKERLELIMREKGALPTGISYCELNNKCQECIPVLVHLWVNGWDFGKEDPVSIFGR
jgi:ribonuclease D